MSIASAIGAMAHSCTPSRLSVAALNGVAIAIILLSSVGCAGTGNRTPEQMMDFVIEDAVGLRICSIEEVPNAESEPRLSIWLAECEGPAPFDYDLQNSLRDVDLVLDVFAGSLETHYSVYWGDFDFGEIRNLLEARVSESEWQYIDEYKGFGVWTSARTDHGYLIPDNDEYFVTNEWGSLRNLARAFADDSGFLKDDHAPLKRLLSKVGSDPHVYEISVNCSPLISEGLEGCIGSAATKSPGKDNTGKEQRLAMFEGKSHARSQVHEVEDSIRASLDAYRWQDYEIDDVELDDEFVIVDVTWHSFWNR